MEFDKIGANVSGHQTTFRGYNYAIEMIIKVIVAIAHILYPSFSIIRIDNIVRWGGGYIEGVDGGNPLLVVCFLHKVQHITEYRIVHIKTYGRALYGEEVVFILYSIRRVLI